ncbi:MAG: hypothetical protein K5893_11580, partial [Prevotella sp.]|nr:hypothetical protein [Prevotella sp.]
MRNSGCTVYLIAIAIVFVTLILPAMLYGVTGGSFSYWQILGTLCGLVAVVFGGWYFAAMHLKKPSYAVQDKEYMTKQLAESSKKTKSDLTDIEENKPSFLFKKFF